MRLLLASSIILGLTTMAYADMGVSFDWGPTKKCFDPDSPPFKLSGVPGGTASLDFRMTDRNAPDFVHGGGKVAYKGQNSLSYGAFKYKGPCPPSGAHSYVFTVKALDAKGKTLATAKAQRDFSQ
jgi:hypothetical protein